MMVQKEEGQNEAWEAGKGTSVDPRLEAKMSVSKKLASAATVREVINSLKQTSKNPHLKEILKLQASNFALSLLAGLEVLPGVTKISTLPKVVITAIEIASKGGKKGYFADLYKDVPKPLKALPVAPELYQSVVNQFKTYKEALNFGKDAINKFVHPQANIQAARLLFTPQRREKIYG